VKSSPFQLQKHFSIRSFELERKSNRKRDKTKTKMKKNEKMHMCAIWTRVLSRGVWTIAKCRTCWVTFNNNKMSEWDQMWSLYKHSLATHKYIDRVMSCTCGFSSCSNHFWVVWIKYYLKNRSLLLSKLFQLAIECFGNGDQKIGIA